MFSTPENTMPDDLADRACEELARQVEAQRMYGNYTKTHVRIWGEAEGGYPDSVLLEAGRRYVSKGWHVYVGISDHKTGYSSLHVSSRDMLGDWKDLGISRWMIPVTVG